MNKAAKQRTIPLKLAIILAALLVVLSGDIGYNIATSKYRSMPDRTSAAAEKPLIDYINQVRAEHGVQALREIPSLDQSAKLKGDDMAARNYWEHTTPDGKPFYFLIQQTAPGLKIYGENLAECQTGTQQTIDEWKASPGHLKNIVEPRYNVFGSYTVWDSDRSCMITVNHFAQE